MTRPSSPGKTPPSAPEPEEAKGGDSEPAAPAEDSGKKERVLHTRVPAVLERELKRFAENLRVPVSNLVRAILEDAVAAADAASESVEGRLTRAAEEIGKGRERLKKRVMPDPLSGVYAFQPVTLAQPASCARCGTELSPGERAHLGMTDTPPKTPQDRLFVCGECLPHE
ncbi:MAG: hypothetical protein R3F14_22885 [Polyangiaceae bacterium]